MSTQTQIPRDPSHYRLSIHAGQRRVERDIPKEAIADTIETGEVRHTNHENKRLFVKQYPGDEYPVGVVANVEDGEIVTVEWRY